MRYRGEHKKMTRQRVLDAGAVQLRNQGPDGISVAGVMGAVGLTHGGFYAHFESREQLLCEIVDQMFEDGPIRTLVGSGHSSPRRILGDFVDFYLSRRHRDMERGACALPCLVSDAARLPVAARARISRGVVRMTNLVEQHLRELDQENAEDIASACVSELIGAVILARAEPDPVRSDQVIERARRIARRQLGLEEGSETPLPAM